MHRIGTQNRLNKPKELRYGDCLLTADMPARLQESPILKIAMYGIINSKMVLKSCK